MTAATFKLATAPLDFYHALYIINEGSEQKIRAVVQNILNVLQDPRLSGKLFIELLAFGEGIELFRTSNPYGALLERLRDKGVVFVLCANTLVSKAMDAVALHAAVQLVPSANGEIVLRQYEGWAVVHP